jgi:Predicted alternative thymidylate synthase
MPIISDPYFRVELIAATPTPQQVIYAAMHQDYSEGFVFDERSSWPDETRAGELCVKRLLAGERGHYGPTEHVSIVLNAGWFPHSVMQQARTHRVGVSFDVQCLDQASEITVVDNDGLKSGTLTLEKIAALWSKDPSEVRALRLRSLDEQRNEFVVNRIFAVFDGGLKPVLEIKLADGKVVRCTSEHRILTTSGWYTAGELKENQAVMVNGRPTADAPSTYQNKEWLEIHYAKGLIPREVALIAGVSTEAIKKWSYHHSLSWQKRPPHSNEGKKLNISETERERRRSHGASLRKGKPNHGPSHPSWKSDLPIEKRAYNWLKYTRPNLLESAGNTCQDCGTPHSRLHCHHIYPVLERPDLAMDEGNMVVLCPRCHKLRHRLAAHAVRVVSIRNAGTVQTYDIAMEAPHHNFVADGVVVHNSGRYTGERVLDVCEGTRDVEEVFYLRPVGLYQDRKGKRYEYTMSQRNTDLGLCLDAAQRYAQLIDLGYAEEHARGILPFDIRQHFVVSFSLRSALHFLDLRSKRDAQPEIQALCDMVWPHVTEWVPEIAGWYETNRLHRARLAP